MHVLYSEWAVFIALNEELSVQYKKKKPIILSSLFIIKKF